MSCLHYRPHPGGFTLTIPLTRGQAADTDLLLNMFYWLIGFRYMYLCVWKISWFYKIYEIKRECDEAATVRAKLKSCSGWLLIKVSDAVFVTLGEILNWLQNITLLLQYRERRGNFCRSKVNKTAVWLYLNAAIIFSNIF